jgi:pseudomonalisin/xanthomonalisin
MAVGGTTLSTSNGAWAGETAWSCTGASDCQQSGSGGAGGGPSLTEKASSWQIASGVLGASTMRGVPDISYDASPSSGALVLVNGSQVQIGGTSLAAPLWAGFWARIQSLDNNGLPFPAQTLYQGGASHPEWFHDITSGNQGYAAAAGWDYASGWGSIQVDRFATAFECGECGGQLTPNFSFTTNGLTASFVSSSTDTGGTINAYLWNFGDGTTSTVANPTHTYAAVGTFSNLNAAPGYASKSLDLTPWIGKTVTVRFSGKEDSSRQTSFVLDDIGVSLQ